MRVDDLARPPVLPVLLGDAWYDDRPGGLNRYFGDLLGALGDLGVNPRGALLGPAFGAPVGVACGGRESQPVIVRLWQFRRAANRAALGATLVDSHFALNAAWPLLFGPVSRLPLVVHFQGPWAAESRVEGASVFEIHMKHLLERLVYRRALRVIVLSGAFKRLLVESYGVVPWRIDVVPPGVDLARFSPGSRVAARMRLDLRQDVAVVAVVRRLVPRMGLDVLLEAWALLQLDCGDRLLVIAGEGPERARLEGLARRLDITSSVRFMGRVGDSALVSLYQAADVSVVPSIALEGFGLTLLESLACGTPVVGTDVGGIPEALVGLDPSLIVPAGDRTALAGVLGTVLANSMIVPDADRCRGYAESFSWERAARCHKGIYCDALRPVRTKLRVVYLDHCAQLSGGEVALARLLPFLTDVDAHVILAEDGPLGTTLLEAGISAEVLQMAEVARGLPRGRVGVRQLPGASVVQTAAYVFTLARRLRRLKPDLVHTNSLKAALYGGMAARFAHVPVVWHIRDRIDDEYLPPHAARLVRAVGRRLPTAVIANSQATLDTLGVISAPSVVVGSPVGLDYFKRRRDPAQITEGALRVGIIGRLAPWKGQHLFLEAFALAFDGGEEKGVVVGGALFGEAEYEAELRGLVRVRGLEDRVEFTGFQADVAGELAKLDVVVHASILPEPFGLVVAEAMAMGLPVVAADAGGPAEMIADGVSGLLYPIGNVAGLANAMKRLANDVGLRRRLGNTARELSTRFRPEVAATKVMAVYREALGSGWPEKVPRP